jgi:hypothetical protein
VIMALIIFGTKYGYRPTKLSGGIHVYFTERNKPSGGGGGRGSDNGYLRVWQRSLRDRRRLSHKIRTQSRTEQTRATVPIAPKPLKKLISAKARA